MVSTQSLEGWPRIAVVGAGAVGCYFGGMLSLAGAPVTFIGRALQVEALRAKGLTLESVRFTRTLAVEASTDMRSAADAKVVLLCVKTTDTEEAARALAPHLAEGAVVVSLQNGVDNASRIRAAAGIDAVPAVVYVGAEAMEPGRVKHTTRGDLVLGDHPELAKLFEQAGIPVRISDNVDGDLWMKFVLNCAYNALSAIAHAEYGRLARSPWMRAVMRDLVEEVVAAGTARGVRFPVGDPVAATLKFGEGLDQTISSTAQDIARGKPTEIDSLNGYVARLGEELKIPTPVNRTLHALVKLLEEGFS